MNHKINLKIKKIIIKNSGDLKMVEVEPIKTTVEELRKLVNIQNFIGEPIEVEDKVIIPVSKVGVAFGVGENKSEKLGLIIGDLIKTFVGSRGGMESPAEEETVINVDDIQHGEYTEEAKEAAEEVKSIIIEDDE